MHDYSYCTRASRNGSQSPWGRDRNPLLPAHSSMGCRGHDHNAFHLYDSPQTVTRLVYFLRILRYYINRSNKPIMFDQLLLNKVNTENLDPQQTEDQIDELEIFETMVNGGLIQTLIKIILR